MSCTTLKSNNGNGIFPSSSPPSNNTATSSTTSSSLHCRASSNANNSSSSICSSSSRISTDNQNNNNSYATRTRRTSFSSCKGKSLELSSPVCSPRATKPMNSNGGSSFGLRRRYSFESFELKKGSSSGSWPKFSQGFKATTLETIPPSPIGEHPGFLLLSSEDPNLLPGSETNTTEAATETTCKRSSPSSPLFNAKIIPSVTPAQPPEPPSSSSTSSSTLLETHHDNKLERKVLRESDWSPCQKSGNVMLKGKTCLDLDHNDDDDDDENVCTVTGSKGKTSQEELLTASSAVLHCDKLINAKDHDGDVDDDEDDETFGSIIKSPMHTINFLLDELFYESVIAFKYFKSGASWLLQSYYEIPARISTTGSPSSLASSSSLATLIPQASQPPPPTFLCNIINFQQSKYIEKLRLLLAFQSKRKLEESGTISQSTEQTLSTEENGKSDTSPESSSLSVGEFQQATEAEQVKDQKVTNDPYDNESNTQSSSWLSTNTIKKLGDYVKTRRTSFMTSSFSSSSSTTSSSSSEFVASTLFTVAIALIVLVTTLLLLMNSSVVSTGTERKAAAQISTKFMHVVDEHLREEIPILDHQQNDKEEQQQHDGIARAPAGDSLPYDSNGRTEKSSCSNRILALKECHLLQRGRRGEAQAQDSTCKSTADEVEAKTVQLQTLESTTSAKAGIAIVEQEALTKKASKEQTHISAAQFDKQERAVWFVLSVLFTILSSSCCLTLFLVYLNRTYYHCCSHHHHHHTFGTSSSNHIHNVGQHCKSDPSCIRGHAKFANRNQCLADHKLGDNSSRKTELGSSSALVVSSSLSSSTTTVLCSCPKTASTTNTLISDFLTSAPSHSLSVSTSPSTATTTSSSSSQGKGLRDTLNLRLDGDLFKSRNESEKIVQGYHDAPTSSDPLSLAPFQEQHQQTDQYKNTSLTVYNVSSTDSASSSAYNNSKTTKNCRNRTRSVSPFDFGGEASIGKRSRTNYSTCLSNSKRADKGKTSHDDNNSSTKSASVIVAIDDDNNDDHKLGREEKLVLSHRRRHSRPHDDVVDDNDYNVNENGYEDTKNIWLLGKFKSCTGVDCDCIAAIDDNDREKSTSGQHIYEHCSNNHHHYPLSCTALVTRPSAHRESEKEEVSSPTCPSSCVYYYFNYFLDKFSQPDKVLFPIFWTAFLVDFNFPNCSLLHAAFLAVAIKLINLYHHYCYFSRFWGEDFDIRINKDSCAPVGIRSSVVKHPSPHQQDPQSKNPLAYSIHEDDSSNKKSLDHEKKRESVQQEEKEEREKIRENVDRKKNDQKVFWADCHPQPKQEKASEKASDERNPSQICTNLVDDSNHDDDVRQTRATEADKSYVSTHSCPCPCSCYSGGHLVFSTSPVEQQCAEIGREKVHFSLLLLFPPRKNNLLGSSSKLTIWLLLYFIVIRRLGSLIWFGWPVFTHILGILGLFLGQLCVQRLSWCKADCCSYNGTTSDISYSKNSVFLEQNKKNSGSLNILQECHPADDFPLKTQKENRQLPHQTQKEDDFIPDGKQQSCTQREKVRNKECSSYLSLDNNKRGRNHDDDDDQCSVEKEGRSRRNCGVVEKEIQHPSESFGINKGSVSASPPSIISIKEEGIIKKSTTSRSIPYKRSRSVLSFSDFNSSLAGKNSAHFGAPHSIPFKSDLVQGGARRITFNLDSSQSRSPSDSNYSRVLNAFANESDNQSTSKDTLVGQSRTYNPSSLFCALPEHTTSHHPYTPHRVFTHHKKPSGGNFLAGRQNGDDSGSRPILGSNWTLPFTSSGGRSSRGARQVNNTCSPLCPDEREEANNRNRNCVQLCGDNWAASSSLLTPTEENGGASPSRNNSISSSSDSQSTQLHSISGSSSSGSLVLGSEESSSHQPQQQQQQPKADIDITAPGESFKEFPHPRKSNFDEVEAEPNENTANNNVQLGIGYRDSISQSKLAVVESSSTSCLQIEKGDEQQPSSSSSSSAVSVSRSNCNNKSSSFSTCLASATEGELKVGESSSDFKRATFRIGCGGSTDDEDVSSILYYKSNPESKEEECVDEVSMRKTLLVFGGAEDGETSSYGENILSPRHFPFQSQSHFHEHSHSCVDSTNHMNCKGTGTNNDASGSITVSSTVTKPPTPPPPAVSQGTVFYGNRSYVSQKFIGHDDGGTEVSDEQLPSQNYLHRSRSGSISNEQISYYEDSNCNSSSSSPPPPPTLLSSVLAKRLFQSGNQCFVSSSSSPVLHSSTPPQQLLNHGHHQNHHNQQQQGPLDKYLGSKMRRTSLPAALPAQRTAIHHHGSAGVDTALLYEAHGLVTEMLLDQTVLPPNIVAGLKALATLLKPLPTSTIHYQTPRPKPVPLTLSIDPDYTSDMGEIPYTGEKISQIPKRNAGQGKKGVSANLLRRMSTSTWTTTTSATGMPTLEPQPNNRRRRSASFRSSAMDQSRRRYSQHELSSHGQRKTLCSLHPLSPSDLTHLSALAASTGFSSGGNAIKSASASVSAAGSNRSSPASTPIPSPAPSPVPSRDPSPCNHRTGGHRGQDQHRDSLPQQEANISSHSSTTNLAAGSSAECIGPGSMLYQRTSPSHSPGTNRLSLKSSFSGSSGTVGGTTTSGSSSSSVFPNPNSSSPPNCRQRDYSPPKVLFHSTIKPDSSSAFAIVGVSDRGESEAGIDGDSLGLLSGKNPDEDNCSTTSTLGDGPGPPDNSSGNSNSLRLSPVTFTLQEPPDNEPYFSADDDGREDAIVTSDGIRFDLQTIAVDPLLCRLHEWDYPIFDLERSSRTQILSHMCYKVFLETGLFETFRIPMKEFITYFHALELGYRDKPYHNRMHAGDVLHGVYYLTSQAIPGFQMVPADPETPSASDICGQRAWFPVEEASYGIMGANFTSLELMALYVAAAMHDYDHPGRTNAFLVSTHAKEAILYNDRSVLENHHAAAAWSLLLSNDDCNFLKYLDKAEFKRFRYLVIEAILATDLKRHFEIVAEFNSKVNEHDSPGIDWTQEDDRLLVMEVCIKLADINGPCKVHDIHVQWTYRIAEEFYEQGDEEAELGLPISPFMDRDHPQLARLQESFINHLVAPLCKACAEAGLLPGYWIDDENEGDAEGDMTTADELSIATSSCQETDNENDESSYSDDNPTIFNCKRKTFCLQTKHLQDNHRHWMHVIKDEAKKKEEIVVVKTESVAISTEDPMETILEENNTPHSLNRSFSFEKEDSKL